VQPARIDLTHGDVVAWALGVTVVCWIVAQQLFLAAPNAARDLVVLVGTELPVYLGGCALFAARRPGRTFEELFALRRAPPGLLVTAFLLGLAVHAPAEKLNTLMTKLFPLKKELAEELATQLLPHGVGHALVLVLVVAVAGPFVEELLYRGALYTGLRRTASAPSAAMTTGLLFTLIHLEPRSWLPIFLLACCLGYVRAASGSLWPGVLLHAAFNGSTLALTWIGPRAETLWLAPTFVAGSSVAALLLILLSARLAQRSDLAGRARALDAREPSSDGATP
jgi:membrane protease YdiL (CAAX protease family)